MAGLCRDCLHVQIEGAIPGPCPLCQGHRWLVHPELTRLGVAHIDCDAFYASIEKRDRPELAEKPLLVGGGKRGVVSTACYLARLYGVGSAMPMFKALKACPEAVVIKPDMAKYSREGKRIRALMQDLTPLVEPLSIDEAFLDLSGTEALHGGPPARSLARLALEVERQVGVTVSIGLSHNKFLAKMASELDKPRGFAVVGEAETLDFLAGRPVEAIFGVGRSLAGKLHRDGIRRIGDLRRHDVSGLTARYGSIGGRLHALAHGRDNRRVSPDGEAKSISSETTFEEDLLRQEDLEARLWPLCETVARRLRRAELAAGGLSLKLKTAGFRILTRSRRLTPPTQSAAVLFEGARPLLAAEADGRSFRLIGIGAASLLPAEGADRDDLVDARRSRLLTLERLGDQLRERHGKPLLTSGRSLGKGRKPQQRGDAGSSS